MCAASYIDCITPPNGCPSTTPFKCEVNGIETCVKSQTECDCPTGYTKCGFMNYCVRDDRRDMCPKFEKRRCIGAKYFKDGLCKKADDRLPNQVVCPLGKVLCPDLTCKDHHSECPLSPVLTSKVRCVEQTQVSSNSDCPTTISCSNPDDVVCPDGSCVENEIMCKPLKECPDKYPYLCFGSSCQIDFSMCPANIACGDYKSLCEDHICRESCDKE
jgi:hypothetical protein